MPLLMIPGPIEVSPAVVDAFGVAPPAHLATSILEAFGRSLARMREVWMAGADAQPFVVAGSGTLAMEMAAQNVVSPGERAVVVQTGFFSDRMAEMLRRRGASVAVVASEPGDAPSIESIAGALDGAKAVFATHVDTSTGVRCDAEPIARLARERGVLSVFDGVCATAAERFDMEGWGADVYLTASQKAIGLPVGLAMLVASPRALEARRALTAPPPLALDLLEWLPVMQAYEAGRPSYFSTPPTNLILALAVSLDEILAEGIEARFALHTRAAAAMRAAFAAMGLAPVPVREALRANTLSALYYPAGVGPDFPAAVAKRGVVIAGGLHPAIKDRYFRVGHMGHVLGRPDDLAATVRAIAEELAARGVAIDTAAALAALR